MYSHYNATSDKRDCGETSLYSAMFRCNILCAHHHYLGKEFPQIPDVELELSKQFNELVPDIQEDKYKRKEMEHDYIIKIIVNTIKKYCHSKVQKEEIKKFVVENYKQENKRFVQGYPIEFFISISNGIDTFSQ